MTCGKGRMSPDLEALAKTLRAQFTMHMNTGKAHLYAHDILDSSGKVIGWRSKYSPKKKGEAARVGYTMDDKEFDTTEAFLAAYRDKLRDQEWEAAAPKEEGT